ncbi:NFATC2-interacting protein isoform X1 [Anguilla rostrata]|uniref:NFATC2-interacting protein isoform X1 n=1 Tax=Anguilla rostrata TaxID=7938 RepID=UPI0030CBE639
MPVIRADLCRFLLSGFQVSDSDSDSEVGTPVRPPPKRRRIIDPTTLITVPIYSNKVNSSLQLKPSVFVHADSTGNDAEVPKPWPWSQAPPPAEEQPITTILSDSEEDAEKDESQQSFRSLSPPPPPQSPQAKVTMRANRKIRELDRKLNAIGSLLSPARTGAGDRRYDDSEDDEVVIISAPHAVLERSDESREIPLKFRCRTDLHKIPMQSTAPLSVAVQQLSVKLNVPTSRILLLRKDTELPVESTANELGLGIADIIDCVVIAEGDTEKESDRDIITVRLQSKDKGSTQDYSLHKEDPLGPILSQYLSHLGISSRSEVRFLFDGSKVADSHTPSQLDMEDGDVIEVWA